MTTNPDRTHCLDDLRFHPPSDAHPSKCQGCTLASPHWGRRRPRKKARCRVVEVTGCLGCGQQDPTMVRIIGDHMVCESCAPTA